MAAVGELGEREARRSDHKLVNFQDLVDLAHAMGGSSRQRL
jgi:hypothetical protein